jgi:hypothetical protein
MSEAGVLAYPVVLAAMYGVFRVGRQERWGSFEWLRLGTLAILLGLLVAVQVKLVMLGVVREPFTVAAGAVSVVGMGFLVGLYLWEMWATRHRFVRVLSARRADVDPIRDG